jgi:hypothetical protein
LTWDERWGTLELGIVSAWERGVEKGRESPNLATAAKAGALVPLPWRGGVEKAIKGEKVGVFWYLAMWQGLRGDDLDLDPDQECLKICTSTNVSVLFTHDDDKLASSSI